MSDEEKKLGIVTDTWTRRLYNPKIGEIIDCASSGTFAKEENGLLEILRNFYIFSILDNIVPGSNNCSNQARKG